MTVHIGVTLGQKMLVLISHYALLYTVAAPNTATAGVPARIEFFVPFSCLMCRPVRTMLSYSQDIILHIWCKCDKIGEHYTPYSINDAYESLVFLFCFRK